MALIAVNPSFNELVLYIHISILTLSAIRMVNQLKTQIRARLIVRFPSDELLYQ